MNRFKAEKKIRRKIQRASSCPFCGNTPKFDVRCDYKHTDYGAWGHYAVRKGCCIATGLGQTELFFTNDFKSPDYRLWWSMASHLVDDWNRRAPGAFR